MSHTPKFEDSPYGYQLTEEEREVVACWGSGRLKRTAFVSLHGREIDDATSRTSTLLTPPTRRVPASAAPDRSSRTAEEDVRNASSGLLSLGREAANVAQVPVDTRRLESQRQIDLKPKIEAVSKCHVGGSSTTKSKQSINYILANSTRANTTIPEDTGKSTRFEARTTTKMEVLQAQSDKILVDNVVACIRPSKLVRNAAGEKSVCVYTVDKRTGKTCKELIEAECEKGSRNGLGGNDKKGVGENIKKCLGGNDEKSTQQPGEETKNNGENDDYEYVSLPLEEEWEKVDSDGDWDFVKE